MGITFYCWRSIVTHHVTQARILAYGPPIFWQVILWRCCKFLQHFYFIGAVIIFYFTCADSFGDINSLLLSLLNQTCLLDHSNHHNVSMIGNWLQYIYNTKHYLLNHNACKHIITVRLQLVHVHAKVILSFSLLLLLWDAANIIYTHHYLKLSFFICST